MSDNLTVYVPRVYRFALRLTGDPHRAEDLTQETFLRAWGKKSSLKNPGAARTWLFRIAVNLWRDEMRRRADVSETTLQNDQTATDIPPEHNLEQREELVQILRCLDSLPPRQREVLYLAAVEEFSLDEISEILEINKNAAKTNLSLARKQMREKYQQPTHES